MFKLSEHAPCFVSCFWCIFMVLYQSYNTWYIYYNILGCFSSFHVYKDIFRNSKSNDCIGNTAKYSTYVCRHKPETYLCWCRVYSPQWQSGSVTVCRRCCAGFCCWEPAKKEPFLVTGWGELKARPCEKSMQSTTVLEGQQHSKSYSHRFGRLIVMLKDI